MAPLLVALGPSASARLLPAALANVTKIVFLTEHGIDPAPGTTTARVDCDFGLATGQYQPPAQRCTRTRHHRRLPSPTEVIATSGSVIICVNITNTNLDPAGWRGHSSATAMCLGKLTSDFNDYGSFDRSSCGPLAPATTATSESLNGRTTNDVAVSGNGNVLVVDTNPWRGRRNMDDIQVAMQVHLPSTVTRPSPRPRWTTPAGFVLSFLRCCRGQAGGMTLTARPTTVDDRPAPATALTR